jgi:hypothetical protein
MLNANKVRSYNLSIKSVKEKTAQSKPVNPGVSPPDGDILFYWPKRGCRKGPATGVEHACSTSSFIKSRQCRRYRCYLSAPVLNGILSQWVTSVSGRTGTAVPFLGKNRPRPRSRFVIRRFQLQNQRGHSMKSTKYSGALHCHLNAETFRITGIMSGFTLAKITIGKGKQAG